MSIKKFLVTRINNFSDLRAQIREKGLIQGIRAYKQLMYWKERPVSNGKAHPDKTFYVIRRWSPSVGVFSYMNSCVTNFRFAKEHGYIPVVDLRGRESIYLTKKNLHKLNVWEMFFEQPTEYTTDDIKNAKNVILNDGAYKYGSWAFDIFDGAHIAEWRPYCKQFVKCNARVMETFHELWNRFFTEEDVVCGVLCRGAGYTLECPPNHPIQPTIDMVIAELHHVKDTLGFTKIYLATEDKDAYRILKEAFGDIVCSVADFTDYTLSDGVIMPSEQDALIKKGVNYTASVLALSKANYLIGGNTSGTIAARLLSDGYQYEHIFDLGRYPKNEES